MFYVRDTSSSCPKILWYNERHMNLLAGYGAEWLCWGENLDQPRSYRWESLSKILLKVCRQWACTLNVGTLSWTVYTHTSCMHTHMTHSIYYVHTSALLYCLSWTPCLLKELLVRNCSVISKLTSSSFCFLRLQICSKTTWNKSMNRPN